MAQDFVDMYQAHISNKLFKRSKHASTQTGESDDQFYYLPNKKSVRLYVSPVYKERVVSFNICSSKSFIVNKTTWLELKKLLPKIEQYLN